MGFSVQGQQAGKRLAQSARLFFCALIGLVQPALGHECEDSRNLPAALEAAFRLIEDAVRDNVVPGAIALVAQDGKVVREQAFGVRRLDPQAPMATDTLCWIASITKPITVAAAMQLVERGELSLDDPVEKFLPEFKEMVDRGGRNHPVTIRQLMSHTSGIQPNPPTRPPLFFEAEWMSRKLAEIPPLIARTRLEFTPGSQVRYSNAAPYVLGRIVELRSGQPFHRYVQQSILDPAGMSDTYFIIPRGAVDRAATVYRDTRQERVKFCQYDAAWNVSMTMPDGGLFSSPRGILKFVQLFLDDKGDVLSHDTVRAMLTRRAPGWGLGWAIDEDGVFHHEGSSGTSAWADPKTGVVGILFFQLQSPQKTGPIQARFREAVRKAVGPLVGAQNLKGVLP